MQYKKLEKLTQAGLAGIMVGFAWYMAGNSMWEVIAMGYIAAVIRGTFAITNN